MFESHNQVGARNRIILTRVSPEMQSGTERSVIDMCSAADRLPLPEHGGACGGTTFKHLTITGELHGY